MDIDWQLRGGVQLQQQRRSRRNEVTPSSDDEWNSTHGCVSSMTAHTSYYWTTSSKRRNHDEETPYIKVRTTLHLAQFVKKLVDLNCSICTLCLPVRRTRNKIYMYTGGQNNAHERAFTLYTKKLINISICDTTYLKLRECTAYSLRRSLLPCDGRRQCVIVKPCKPRLCNYTGLNRITRAMHAAGLNWQQNCRA
jgi:hypothetical protein